MDGGGTGRRDGHLVVYVFWPLLGGLMLGVVGGVASGGVALVFGEGWSKAGLWASGAFFVTWAVATAGVFVYAAAGWGGPARLERMRQEVIEVVEPVPVVEDAPWKVIRPYARMLPSGMGVEVRSLEPEVDPQIKTLYDFVTRAWPGGNVSRARARELGFGRATWERLVGGRRGKVGSESARGVLDRAGVVYQDGGGAWRITPGAALDRALAVNPELERYAQERARLVRL